MPSFLEFILVGREQALFGSPGMEVPLTNMYNIFKDDVFKELVLELGPLDPNWFEVLTSQASVIEGSLSDQEDLCANQEGNSKESLEKPAVESQFFSTPKVFRHSRVVSPQTEDEQSFTSAQEKGALPWTKTHSPCLFQLTVQGDSGEKCEVFHPQGDDSFDLLATPNKSTISYAKHISESLGAQMNPDISWTSSLNTPPAVPSTLILSKPDNKPCSTNFPADGNVVFVRKLFPSLSKSSAKEASKNCDLLAFQGPISPKVPDGPQTFSNQEERVWQQKLPDAIEDGEVHSPVVDVLDGTEDALSIFFANSSSALRKVKPERNKRKQILQAKENVCSSKDDSSTRKTTSDEELGGCTLSSYTKTGHTVISQWSPLSLSDIPSCSVGGNIVLEQLKDETNSSHLSGPSNEIQNVEFQSKKRLVDTVGIAEPHPMRMDSSVEIPNSEELCIGHLETSDCCNVEKTEGHKQDQPAGENLVGTVKAKIQDIDMSQLCRDFAQDFSQMPDSGRAASRDHFSPSACLLAMKKAKQKAEVNPHHYHNKSISNPKFPTSGVPINDSGFHSAVGNCTNITASSFSENTGLSRTSIEFKSDLHIETDFPSTKACPETVLFNAEAEIELISSHTSKEKQELEPGRDDGSSTDVTIQQPSSTQGADDIPSVPLNDQKQSKKTTSPAVHSLGFKTASNKGIRISSASLERAKWIFKESESETAFHNLPTTSDCDTVDKSTSKEAGNTLDFSSKSSQALITETFGGLAPQLTASQTDDVTELCSLLEQTDSQFELTPFKTLKTKQQSDATSPQKADKELDPDFLAGIDFDDSFSSDSLQCARNENVTSSLKHSSQDEASNDPQKTAHSSTPQDNVSGVGFKTAGGKVLRISDKCLSKAKSLFADLEEFPTNRESSGNKRVEVGLNTKQKSSMNPSRCKNNLKFAIDEDSRSIRAGNSFEESASFKRPTKSISSVNTKSIQSKKKDTSMCQTGFLKANGKTIFVQGKNMHHAKDIFKDCDVMDNKYEFIKHLPENIKCREPLLKCENFDTLKRRIGGGSVTENADLLPCDTIEPHLGMLKVESTAASFQRNSFSASKPDPSMLCSASKTVDSNESCSAAGKKAFVSGDETKNSEYLLIESHSPEDEKGRSQENWSSSNNTDQPRICGFQTAGGKELIVSSAALKKAQKMFSENEGVKERNSVLSPHSTIPSTESANVKSHTLQKAKACSDISLNPVNPGENKLKEGLCNVERTSSGFTTTNKANELEEHPLKSNHLLKDFDLVSDKEMQEADVFLENHVEAENTIVLKDQECQPPVCEKVKSNPDPKATINFSEPGYLEEPSSFQNAGFQMANGKTVTFSAEALRRTKSLFNGCEAPEDKTLPTPPQSKTSALPIRGGFCSANGMPISASSEALHKAERLFSDISFSGSKADVSQTEQKVDKNEKINFGFRTAGGAKVHVSKTNILKAKHLFKEFDDLVSDKEMQEADVDLENFDVNAEDSVLTKDQECNLPLTEGANEDGSSNPCEKAILNISEPGNGSSENTNKEILQNKDPSSFQNVGFQTANGKAVTFSAEALRKAKSVFNGCEAPENKMLPTPLQSKASVLPIRGTTEQNQDVKERIHYGFQTAGRTTVPVSKTNLLKAKHLFKDLNDLVSDKEIQKADVFLENVDVHAENTVLTKNPECKLPLTERGDEEIRSDPCQRETLNFSEPGKGSSENTNIQQNDLLSLQNVGFQTANGKAVTFSAEALRKAKSVFNGCEAPENKTLPTPLQSKASVLSFRGTTEQNQDNKERIRFGFQTAGGAKVPVSKTNLLKAKHLFKDLDDSASKAAEGTDPSSEASSGLRKATGLTDNFSKHIERITVNTPANGWTESRGVGFQTASGNAVEVSSEALKRAKSLLGEREEVASISSPLCTIPVSGSSGFFAASGKPVTFSSEALQKAKSLFSDFTDTEMVDQKQEDAQLCSFTAAGGTKPDTKVADECHSSIKELDLFNIKDVKSSHVDTTNLAPSETVGKSENGKLETSDGMDCSRSENTKAEGSSALIFPSLNLTGCSETQHRLLAQEALDCTKALLEDEDLAGQSFSPATQTALKPDYPQTTTGFEAEEKRQRKRLMGDPDPTGQPPLKRQLLEEFNQANEGSKDSALQPVKSCPLGLMKDRGVFKYSTSLYPNITKPHNNEKTKTTTTVQHSTLDNSRSTGSKMSPFIPPFYKNAKSETSKTSVPQQTTRTPVFVPPFKKQRTVLQGIKDENTNQLSPVTESNSSVYVPSTVNAQESSNVISIVDTPSNDTKNPNVDVNGGSVSFGSDVDQAFSKDEHQAFLNSELARDMQDMRIRKKKRQNIRPLQGNLFLTRTSGVARIQLKAAANGKLPARCPPEQLYRCGVHAHVSGITSETAESFRFRLLHFFKRDTLIDEGGVKLADGGYLIPSKDGTAGKEEFFRALCDTPGVDPKLITEAWGYNHYRWIVWKQASMEKSFPETMGGICLTPEQVLLQLKYRYDVEIDRSRRPALRKITEKDDTAAKTLVLCVCEIVSKGGGASGSKTPESADQASAVVWLTDGWYALKAQLDQPLTAMLTKGLLAVGGKLIIHGAQLVGSQDACPPLEAPESLMLKICANSTRRARWDTKLGFHKDPRPFLLPIASLFSNGGPVGCADVVVLRSYPIQWMERKADGGVVFRTTRAEEKEARRFHEVKHKAMEVLFAKVQDEFENEEKEKAKSQRRKQNLDVANLQDGEELHAAVGDDPAYLEAHLSEQQLQTLQAYKRSLMERKQAELQDRYRRALEEDDQEIKCPKRDVTPVWRLSVADSLGPPSCVYQLSLWRPSSDVESLLKEGGRFKVYNLAAAEGKKRSSHESVQLTGTKKTQFQVLQASQEWMSERFQPRASTDFESLQNPDFRPLCGEVDLSGYVVRVIDGHGSSPAFYLADGKLNLVKIRCFSSLSQTGLEDVVKPRVLLALSNLQLRGQSMFPTPVVYAGDLTVFSTNPKEAHLQESLSHLKNRIQSEENFHANAEEKLSHLIKSGGLGLVSPMTVKLQTDKNDESKVTFQKPGSFTPVSKNPQAETPLSKKDPKILKRRRALDYLSRIPSPPPLSVLGSVSSPCVKKTFNPPRRSGPPRSEFKTEKIQTIKPTDSMVEDEWVNDEELVMIDTQALHVGDLM